MIITLTPNPSLDRTLELDHLVRGAVNRAAGGRVDPGGKGVNVSRALAGHGIKTAAVLPVGGHDGTRLSDLLARVGVLVRAVPVSGGVRTNITVAESDGRTTKLNEPGPALSAQEVTDLTVTLLDTVRPGDWVIACGSLPRGVGPDFYSDLIAPLHRRGAKVVVDTSGDALRATLDRDRPDHPDVIKPNHEELVEAVGRPLGTLGEVVRAARELVDRGITTVLASLGANGAMLVTADLALYGSARVEHPRSTVGAGDALLAGYLSTLKQPSSTLKHQSPQSPQSPQDRARTALATALAWGSAATCLPGSRMPTSDDVAAIAVTVHDSFDPRQPLDGDAP